MRNHSWKFHAESKSIGCLITPSRHRLDLGEAVERTVAFNRIEHSRIEMQMFVFGCLGRVDYVGPPIAIEYRAAEKNR